MEDRRITELAKAGGICQLCGGICQPAIEHSILATNAGLPLCTCPDCRICQRVRQAIEALEDTEEAAWKQ